MNKQPMLQLNNVTVTVNNGGQDIDILKAINLNIYPGDFVTILGTNGAGKSTLFNVISGHLTPTSGQILLNGEDVTKFSEEKRAKYISRVFQDPKLGTAPRMTVGENLLLAQKRGQHRGLKLRKLKQQRQELVKELSLFENGLENRFETPTGDLSGGQRQALSLVMAVSSEPDLLLLDEHTAALDPKTSAQLMTFTNQVISERQLTCLMITHHLDDALAYGNRLLVLNAGQIAEDYDQTTKANLSKEDMLEFFDSAIA
ncbi:ABC transporter ATP-binding protein [Agrilactobacillus fermenti]|uniref:ABC transporter ATP-binding protein n=1 Tax=Agrilactobacillus fermenti TaxID=2586909 RepID=UPI001E3360F7|nr:ATP-binding cassette domain-containing protein [Agrilactobacillus fermenti]MCD2257188.1 ATP-binding cassette domain-containing protein [Agrilactobacillus fermenti]